VTDSDEAISRLIVASGEDLPPRLVAAIGKARLTLASTIRQERAYPGRKELRQRLEKLAKAIELVRGEMLDFDMAMLLRAGDKALLYERETYQGLGELAERVKKTLDAIPSRKGRDKHFWRSEGATPQQNCALIVSILWERTRSALPLNTEKCAQQACAALWAAAGGPVEVDGKIVGIWTDRSDPSTAVWRDHLRAAKKLAESEEANFLRQSLDADLQ
jgi:hypothetical protein